MLSEKDIAFIKQANEDIRINRQYEVTLHWIEVVPGEADPWTGQPTEATQQPKEIEIQAVVTEVSVGSTDAERELQSGILVEEGDIIVDVLLGALPVDYRKITSVTYDGEDYEIVGADKLGLGGYNRVEMVGRLRNG
ncbi:hypothetical protein AB1K91_17990 [Terribacillus sp. 179-K 1B1 HS]|uniref:hypothetical protein n=1 Tax=Terribacillus sp. 179-K 1B1 HS TaxID=3142388 RepID=UPI0039A370A6